MTVLGAFYWAKLGKIRILMLHTKALINPSVASFLIEQNRTI